MIKAVIQVGPPAFLGIETAPVLIRIYEILVIGVGKAHPQPGREGKAHIGGSVVITVIFPFVIYAGVDMINVKGDVIEIAAVEFYDICIVFLGTGPG
jgi:hypothetical protein